MGKSATGFSTDQGTMDYINNWVREHINVQRYQRSQDGARAQELAAWLRSDAAGSGISGAEIDSAIASAISGGRGLVDYLSEAMEAVTNATVPTPQASRPADEIF